VRLAEAHGDRHPDSASKNDGRPNGPAPLIDEQLPDQLLGRAQAEGVQLLGPDGLIS
jgi:hypothetical protein